METKLGERLDRWLPDGLAGDVLIGTRFLVRAWALAVPSALLSSLLYAANGSWGQVAFSLPLALTGVLALLAIKRGCARTRVTHTTLVVALLSFGGSTLAQTPADTSNIAFLAVLPLVASFVLGRRAAALWLGVVLVAGLALLGLAETGTTLPYVDDSPFVSHAINLSLMMILLWLFARVFDGVRARAFEAVRAADRAKSTLLATVSHEIRTPMNAVLGMTELMLGDVDDPITRERLGILKRSGERLLAIVNDVLDAMKIEAHKLEVERVRFDLATLVSDLELLYRTPASRGGLTLVIDHDLSVQSAAGDPLRLSQVIGNLLDNAIKFTERGRVTLRVRRRDAQHVAFAVEDTGNGMDAATLALLFTPFQQGHPTTRRHGGTGLGLSLARSLVELMGGRLEVASTPGVGTRFSFDLPIEPSVDPVVASAELWPEASGQRVLIVDDNPLNVAVATGLLERVGCRVESASSGREALTRASQGGFALVLMDLYMPDMDGIEATRLIHGMSPAMAAVPIIGVTASAAPEELAACRAAGMLDVVTKPVTPAKLRDLLALAV